MPLSVILFFWFFQAIDLDEMGKVAAGLSQATSNTAKVLLEPQNPLPKPSRLDSVRKQLGSDKTKLQLPGNRSVSVSAPPAGSKLPGVLASSWGSSQQLPTKQASSRPVAAAVSLAKLFTGYSAPTGPVDDDAKFNAIDRRYPSSAYAPQISGNAYVTRVDKVMNRLLDAALQLTDQTVATTSSGLSAANALIALSSRQAEGS